MQKELIDLIARLRRLDWAIIPTGQIDWEAVGFLAVETIVTDENPNANIPFSVARTYLL